jgi:hypothetical protein
MPNTLTALQPILFSVAQEVSAEPFGAVDAINTNFDSKGVAIGDVVKVPVAPTRAAKNFTPGAAPPAGDDAVATEVSVQITKSRLTDMYLTGEQIRSLDNGATSAEWIRQMVAQMMRTLRNEAEIDCVNAIYQGASRASGTAGTNPFASALTPLADVRKILRDNGAPMADMQFVGDTTSEANLLKLGVVLDASIAGNDEERRSGMIRRQYGFNMRTSAGIEQHVAGAGTGYLVNGARVIGDTGIVVDGGTVNTTGIKAGDVVTFAADAANKYIVNTGLVAAAGAVTIGRPGAQAVLPDNNALTIGGSYTPNLAFERSAIVGIMRPPVMPANPTISQTLISDGMGMTYLLLDIAQYGQRKWELHLAWGFKAVQPEHIALLLG